MLSKIFHIPVPVTSVHLTSVFLVIVLSSAAFSIGAEPVYIPSKEELAEGQVEIIAGESKTVFEYRVNGRLLMIKIVPKFGATYYMVPADGQPHFESLDHKKKLYPQWVIVEF
jgi:hypothetical protein